VQPVKAVITDDNEPYTRPGWNGGWEVYRTGSTQPARDIRSSSTASLTAFGSAHPTGFNAVFADGSVRHIRYAVNLTTWRRACVLNDGEVYSLNDL
jgi:prepilin-type processing-associated H-X9-DG protein